MFCFFVSMIFIIFLFTYRFSRKRLRIKIIIKPIIGNELVKITSSTIEKGQPSIILFYFILLLISILL